MIDEVVRAREASWTYGVSRPDRVARLDARVLLKLGRVHGRACPVAEAEVAAVVAVEVVAAGVVAVAVGPGELDEWQRRAEVSACLAKWSWLFDRGFG